MGRNQDPMYAGKLARVHYLWNIISFLSLLLILEPKHFFCKGPGTDV
jgi:hypothetical protein